LNLTFDDIRFLFKWKFKLVKVMHFLNRSLIHSSYHSLHTVKPILNGGVICQGIIGRGAIEMALWKWPGWIGRGCYWPGTCPTGQM